MMYSKNDFIVSENSCSKKIIVFAPHPDDETLGCGGTIIKKLTQGYEIFIVILTDGRNAYKIMLNIDNNPSPEELSEIRKMEVINATKILGVKEKNIIFLNYEDGLLCDYMEDAKIKVYELLNKIQPNEIFFTCKDEANMDHNITNEIINHVIKMLDYNVIKYEYSIMPRNTMIKIKRLFSKKNIVDVSDYLNIKKRAINEYKTFTTIMSPYQQKPLYDNNRLKKHLNRMEVFYVN